MGWVMKRLGIGAVAMQSGMARREVLDESCFRKGLAFNDDRSSFNTKNEDFPAEAQLQQLFWVKEVSRTSTNTGDNIRQCLGSKKDEGFDTDVYDVVVVGSKTVKKRRCIHGPTNLTQETDISSKYTLHTRG